MFSIEGAGNQFAWPESPVHFKLTLNARSEGEKVFGLLPVVVDVPSFEHY